MSIFNTNSEELYEIKVGDYIFDTTTIISKIDKRNVYIDSKYKSNAAQLFIHPEYTEGLKALKTEGYRNIIFERTVDINYDHDVNFYNLNLICKYGLTIRPSDDNIKLKNLNINKNYQLSKNTYYCNFLGGLHGECNIVLENSYINFPVVYFTGADLVLINSKIDAQKFYRNIT